MTVLRQMFDDCTLHGLKHAWRTFTIEAHGTLTGSRNSGCSCSTEVPTYAGPDPFKEQKISHVRRCLNCMKVDEFVINNSGSWEAKQEEK